LTENIHVIDPHLPGGENYSGIVIRPPCEAYSVLIGLTEGCNWNKCAFCGVYKGIQRYRVRTFKEIQYDIHQALLFHGKHASRVFLAGGSAFSAPTDHLLQVLAEVRNCFPSAIITSYAKNLDILEKTEEQLSSLRKAGLSTLYMGLESGSDKILEMFRKGSDSSGMIEASKKAMNVGFELSLYVILGLGGKKLTNLHARETARVINEISPNFVRFRTLNILRNSSLYHWIQQGKFSLLTPLELLKEQYAIISNLDCATYVFNDHVSNYAMFEGPIPEQTEAMLKLLKAAIEDPSIACLSHKKLVSM